MGRKRKLNPTGIHLYDVTTVAERYGFHPNTVYSWVKAGLRCYRGPRGKIFIREDDLTDFLIREYAISAATEDE